MVLAEDAAALAGCGAAFVAAEQAEAALDAGVDDVLGLSGHPLGAPAPGLPALVLDYAREVPSYADHFGGPRPGRAVVEAAGRPVEARTGITPQDRVLTTLDPADPLGAAVLLGALRAGAGLVLLCSGSPEAVAGAERVTLTAGCDVSGLTRTA